MADGIFGFASHENGLHRESMGERALGRVATNLESAFFGVGRGGLDAVGLEGHDIKGFAGGLVGPEGQEMKGADFLHAIGRMDRDGLDPIMGKGFEESALSAGRDLFLRGGLDMERGRNGIGRGD